MLSKARTRPGFLVTSIFPGCVEPIYAKGAQLKVQQIKRIWCEGEHNAFPDVQRFRDNWFVATREGTAYGISGFGRVRVISSEDGKHWQSVALLDGFGDYRRGELSVTANGRLMRRARRAVETTWVLWPACNGVDSESPGDISDLQRHLVYIHRETKLPFFWLM